MYVCMYTQPTQPSLRSFDPFAGVNVDYGTIDIILVSNHTSMFALPFITGDLCVVWKVSVCAV